MASSAEINRTIRKWRLDSRDHEINSIIDKGSLVGSVGSWSSATLLLSYATTFSYAYITLGAATGALVLFGVVQAVIFASALRSSERVGVGGIGGLLLAGAGLIALVGPGLSRPDPLGTFLMAIAGISWAGYTLRGRNGDRPLFITAGNFLRSAILALVLWAALASLHGAAVHANFKGVVLAVVSGAVTSGLGYALWYKVLPALNRAQSGIIQMAPAPLATLGGLVLLGEPITAKILLASSLILTGVLLGVLRPN